MVAVIVAVVVFWIALSYWSLADRVRAGDYRLIDG